MNVQQQFCLKGHLTTLKQQVNFEVPLLIVSIGIRLFSTKL